MLNPVLAEIVTACRALVPRTLVDLERGDRPALVELMTPVAKAFATEAAQEAAGLAVQVHGGYGFLREYRVEQIARDGRITPIYEGTNGIQAATLAGRLIRQDGTLAAFRAEIGDALAAARSIDTAPLADALAAWETATAALLERSFPGAAAVPYLRLTGLTAFGAVWARLEAAAGSSRLRAVATFVRRWMLPEATHLAALCCSPPLPDVPADVFEG